MSWKQRHSTVFIYAIFFCSFFATFKPCNATAATPKACRTLLEDKLDDLDFPIEKYFSNVKVHFLADGTPQFSRGSQAFILWRQKTPSYIQDYRFAAHYEKRSPHPQRTLLSYLIDPTIPLPSSSKENEVQSPLPIRTPLATLKILGLELPNTNRIRTVLNVFWERMDHFIPMSIGWSDFQTDQLFQKGPDELKPRIKRDVKVGVTCWEGDRRSPYYAGLINVLFRDSFLMAKDSRLYIDSTPLPRHDTEYDVILDFGGNRMLNGVSTDTLLDRGRDNLTDTWLLPKKVAEIVLLKALTEGNVTD